MRAWPRWWALFPAAALAGALAGCAGREPAEVVRLIPEDAQSIFTIDAVSARTERFDWSFAPLPESAAAARPPLTLDAGWKETDSGVLTESASGRIGVQLATSLDATAVSDVVVTVSDLNRGGVQLSWDVAGLQGPRQERLMFLGHLEHSGGSEKRYTFDVSSHPMWQGTVSALRVTFRGLFESRVVLRRVQGFERILEEAKLVAAISRPWKSQIGSELRNALLAPPGVVQRHAVEIPRGDSVLRFARATTSPLDRPVEFVVKAEAGDGQVRELFRETLAASSVGSERRWLEDEVDLASIAGQRIELLFETVTAEPLDPLAGLPVWGHPEIVPAASPELANVILVSVDTLRADHLSLYGYQRATSPRLDAWARSRAVVFEQAITQAPWTLPSHLSMLSGLDALRHGANQHSSIAPADLQLLAETLREAGYWTQAVTGSGFVHPRYGFAQGFDVYYHDPRKTTNEDELELEMERALAALRDSRSPFFLFLHTFEVHPPLRARQPYFDRFSDRPAPERGVVMVDGQGIRLRVGSANESFDDLDTVVDLYDSGIAYTDAQLSRLLEALDEEGLAERTLVVFTSDHGEALGERGETGHNLLAENNLHVPLVIAFPDGRSAGTSVPQQVRLVDIVPTVLDAVGIAAAGELDGVSLLPLLEGQRPASTRVAATYTSRRDRGLSLRVDGRLKYLFDATPWKGAARERLVEVGAGGEDGAAAPPETGRLRSQAAQRFADASGLWLRLANDTPDVLEGSIVGDAVQWDTVKSADMPCDCLELVAAGRARFRVPAKTSYSVLFELVKTGEIALRGELRSPGNQPPLAFDEVFRLEHEAEDNALLLTGSAWERGAAEPSRLLTGLAFEWRGLMRPDGAEAPEVDAELADQLRALGYVN